MKAFVLKGTKGQPTYFNYERNAYAFWERGYEVIRFAAPAIDDGVLDPALHTEPDQCLVSGGVGTIRRALQRAGRPDPVVPDLPECLREWIGRDFWQSTLQEVRERVDDASGPLHVKPLTEQKKFTGVLVASFKDLIDSAAVDGTIEVLVQEAVEFVSEWRASVLRGEIINVAHYRGDPLRFPDRQRMAAALQAFEERPIACSMDWGVTSHGESLLVEVNDGFALGNYGVPMHLYTAMVEARWRELMGLSDNFVGVKLTPN